MKRTVFQQYEKAFYRALAAAMVRLKGNEVAQRAWFYGGFTCWMSGYKAGLRATKNKPNSKRKPK